MTVRPVPAKAAINATAPVRSSARPDRCGEPVRVDDISLNTALGAEESRLRAEKDAAYALAMRKPTIANRKAYQAAEKALADFLRALAEPESTEQAFAGLPEVLEYLQVDHWKIQKTKLYDDFAAGRISAEPDGSFTLTKIIEYARVNLRKEDGTPGAVAGPSLQEQKILEEVGRIRADRLQRELTYKEKSGELIRKSEVEIEFAKRITYLRSDLKNIFRSGAVEIIRQTGGDPQKAPALIAYGVGLVDAALDRYARPIRLGEED